MCGIDPVNHLAVEVENEAENSVGRRMLRAEVDGEIADIVFGHGAAQAKIELGSWQ